MKALKRAVRSLLERERQSIALAAAVKRYSSVTDPKSCWATRAEQSAPSPSAGADRISETSDMVEE